MPNYMIPFSESCYEEFQNIKKQLKINLDLWSDSDILKMIFEKIDLNKEFLKELLKIGKTSKGRMLPPKYPHNISLYNIEDLSKCPTCDHSICMLEHSMKEVARLQMHSHFDSEHNKAGIFKCKCDLTFDWMPGYLRHVSVCEKSKQESIKTSNINDNFESSGHETTIFKPSEKKYKLESSDEIISSPIKNSLNMSLSNSENNDNFSFLKLLCNESQPLNNSIINPNILSAIPNSTILTNESDLSDTMPLNLSMNSTILLTCRCGVVFHDFQPYHEHNLNCSNSRSKEKLTNESEEADVDLCPMKNKLKHVKPNSQGKYECPCCEKSFSSLISLKQHYMGMHVTTSKKRCPKCNKSFSWANSYKHHMKTCELINN